MFILILKDIHSKKVLKKKLVDKDQSIADDMVKQLNKGKTNFGAKAEPTWGWVTQERFDHHVKKGNLLID